MVVTLLIVVYLVCAVLLSVYALGSGLHLIAYLRHRNAKIPTPPIDEFPRVGVQLPIYNEMYVVERLLDAVAKLDYPRDRLVVQVLDDSTDQTSAVLAARVAALRERGLNIVHIRRGSREGYKAGALAYGLKLLDVEMVAVLDADFIPPPDFLKRTVPHLVKNPDAAVVQARWGHLNPYDSLLTMGQTLALDAHFVVEQTARSRAGWLMNFNGSGGVWRVRAIEDAGGWHDATLTEDLDLSYRAQLVGWRFIYLPDLVVPGELPTQIAAYKQQQARWAKGGTQCLRRLIIPVWRSPRLTLTQRLMATLHLCQYVAHPLMVVMMLLTPPLLLSHSLQKISLGVLGLVGLIPPIIFVVSQQALYLDWRKRVLAVPALITLGLGIAWSNARAVVSGLLGHAGEFRRTPKFARKTRGNAYALKLNDNLFFELLMASYALWGTTIALRVAPAFVPYLGMYFISFGIMALWGLWDYVELRAAQPAAQGRGH
jgi:cellulose synthase/poly-beta-1,6-N-acetylglucosamine synthase-like glycosyltransferase